MERTGADNRAKWLAIGMTILGLVGAAALALAWVLSRGGAVAHTDVPPLGANFFLDREVEHWKQEKTLDMARVAGFSWIKQQFSWEEIEPRRKGEFEWAKYDRIVDLAEQYGLDLVARLDRPPAWARPDSEYPTSPPRDQADYGERIAVESVRLPDYPELTDKEVEYVIDCIRNFYA